MNGRLNKCHFTFSSQPLSFDTAEINAAREGGSNKGGINANLARNPRKCNIIKDDDDDGIE